MNNLNSQLLQAQKLREQTNKINANAQQLKKQNQINRFAGQLALCDLEEKKLSRGLPSCPIKPQPFRNLVQKKQCEQIERNLPVQIKKCTKIENQILQLGGKLPFARAQLRAKEKDWGEELAALKVPNKPINLNTNNKTGGNDSSDEEDDQDEEEEENRKQYKKRNLNNHYFNHKKSYQQPRRNIMSFMLLSLIVFLLFVLGIVLFIIWVNKAKPITNNSISNSSTNSSTNSNSNIINTSIIQTDTAIPSIIPSSL